MSQYGIFTETVEFIRKNKERKLSPESINEIFRETVEKHYEDMKKALETIGKIEEFTYDDDFLLFKYKTDKDEVSYGIYTSFHNGDFIIGLYKGFENGKHEKVKELDRHFYKHLKFEDIPPIVEEAMKGLVYYVLN